MLNTMGTSSAKVMEKCAGKDQLLINSATVPACELESKFCHRDTMGDNRLVTAHRPEYTRTLAQYPSLNCFFQFSISVIFPSNSRINSPLSKNS